MRSLASPLTAALAGAFSALAWPWLWNRFGATGGSFDMGLVAGTLLLIALPAHACVLGFQRPASAAGGGVDAALLTRAAAWVAAALVTVGLNALWGG